MPAVAVAFAQNEMVQTFMEGIDPSYYDLLNGLISKVLDEYGQAVIKSFTRIGLKKKKQAEDILKKISKQLLKDILTSIEERGSKHGMRIIRTVAVLPKDELAMMAESLVSLTSLKRRTTMDAETVGGAVDVAVISKGDGFIWIKRKHYFNPENNHHFFANYFR